MQVCIEGIFLDLLLVLLWLSFQSLLNAFGYSALSLLFCLGRWWIFLWWWLEQLWLPNTWQGNPGNILARLLPCMWHNIIITVVIHELGFRATYSWKSGSILSLGFTVNFRIDFSVNFRSNFRLILESTFGYIFDRFSVDFWSILSKFRLIWNWFLDTFFDRFSVDF